MRIRPALAALAAMVKGLVLRKPRKATVEVSLAEHPSRGHAAAARPMRRARIMRSYTRADLRVVLRAPYEHDDSLDDVGNAAARAEYHRAWRLERKRAGKPRRVRRHTVSRWRRKREREIQRAAGEAMARRLAP